MGPLIQDSGRRPVRRAQPRTMRGKSRFTVMRKRPARTVRASLRGTWKPSSGMTPRVSGSTQKTSRSALLSAMGKSPQL